MRSFYRPIVLKFYNIVLRLIVLLDGLIRTLGSVNCLVTYITSIFRIENIIKEIIPTIKSFSQLC